MIKILVTFITFFYAFSAQAQSSDKDFSYLKENEKAYVCSYASFELTKAILTKLIKTNPEPSEEELQDSMNKARTTALYVSVLLDKSLVENQEQKDNLKTFVNKNLADTEYCKNLVQEQIKKEVHNMSYHNDNVTFLLSNILDSLE